MFMHKVGEIVKCLVSGYKDYGIFVKVDRQYTGLIHISEISNGFVKDVSDYVELGEKIYAKIIGIDYIHKQLKLSIKDLDYKKSGESLTLTADVGFLPLQKELNTWINEKIKEIKR